MKLINAPVPVHVYGRALELYPEFSFEQQISSCSIIYNSKKKKKGKRKQTEVVNELPYVHISQNRSCRRRTPYSGTFQDAEMFCSCDAQCSSRWPRVAVERLKCG